MTEKDLIHQLIQKDSQAFTLFVKTYQNQVLNICYRFLLDKKDAEDISQDVFVEVYHTIHRFKAESQLSTWLYRIAVSKSLDELRKRKRKKRFSSIGKALGLHEVSQWLTNQRNPENAYEEHESYHALLKALDQLPESQRIAITLSKLEGYSNAEVALIMGISSQAFDSLLYRAKNNFKKILKDRQNEKK